MLRLTSGAPVEGQDGAGGRVAIKRLVKEAAFFAFALSGVSKYFRRRNKGKVVVLMYHGVVKTPLNPFCWTHTAENAFRNQLVFLKRHYRVVRLSEVLSRVRAGLPVPENSAVITFDDGFKNNFSVAYPILRQMKMPATIFLVTGCISRKEPCWPERLYLWIRCTEEGVVDLADCGVGRYPLYSRRTKEKSYARILSVLKSLAADEKDRVLRKLEERLGVCSDAVGTEFEVLSWEEVRAMDEEGLIEFGGHTVSHNILSRMEKRQVEAEIISSCRTIQAHLGRKCGLFAYPNGLNGDFDEECKRILERNGLVCGVTSISGLYEPGKDVYEIPRIGVGADMSLWRFQCLVSGLLFDLKVRGTRK
ncbi:MAG: polysaccharide deacetylase family protein [Candidatus Methylomirabilales bacterium]